jgi:hypothetical protein
MTEMAVQTVQGADRERWAGHAPPPIVAAEQA